MRNLVDLHTHSSASDGELAPAELVRQAEGRRLAFMALTDHDTLAGLDGAAGAAAALELRFIPGVEISAQFPGGAMHILGLGTDPHSAPLGRALRQLRALRGERNPKVIAKLQGLGVKITMNEVREFASGADDPDAVVGRLHVARLLRAKGYVRSAKEAFERYLSPGRPAFVDKERLTQREAIEAIHAGGGVAVLAHPPQLNCQNAAQLERVVSSLIRDGLDGIEAYHCDHTAKQTRAYLDLAGRLSLLVSGGSDFHGAAKPEARLGRPRVPLAAVEQLLARITR